jgi:hypothetical protein
LNILSSRVAAAALVAVVVLVAFAQAPAYL